MRERRSKKILLGFGIICTASLVLCLHPFSDSYLAYSQYQKYTANLPHFTDITDFAGVNLNLKSVTATWVDYDEDGWLDLFVCNGYNQRNVLYKNSGEGYFTDVTAAVGLVNYCWNFNPHWIDFDGDGDLDLFLGTKDEKYQIFRNDNFHNFENITDIFEPKLFGEIIWADFNNDNLLDIYEFKADANYEQNSSPPNRLLKQLKNNKFAEVCRTANIAGEHDSFHAQWININNDEYLDLFVINTNQQPNFLYLNNGDETFSDIFDSSGIERNIREAHWADFNNDGWV
ncbi:hypothetical protein B6D60_02380, partial [candidate division KSB1 bacterium 4484_87]